MQRAQRITPTKYLTSRLSGLLPLRHWEENFLNHIRHRRHIRFADGVDFPSFGLPDLLTSQPPDLLPLLHCEKYFLNQIRHIRHIRFADGVDFPSFGLSDFPSSRLPAFLSPNHCISGITSLKQKKPPHKNAATCLHEKILTFAYLTKKSLNYYYACKV